MNHRTVNGVIALRTDDDLVRTIAALLASTRHDDGLSSISSQRSSASTTP